MIHVRLAALASAAALLLAGAPSGAVPATAPRPFAWLTPDLVARADAAGPAGVPLPAAAYDDMPATTVAFAGIRPGTMLLDAATQVGTTNFVFQTTAGAFDPTQQLYIGASGHAFTGVGDPAYVVTVGPSNAGAPISGRYVIVRIGTVVSHVHTSSTNDHALIEIDPALNDWVSPSVAFWGGPTGAYTGTSGAVVSFVGNAQGVGGAAPRAGRLQGFSSTGMTVTTVAAGGDSGAPVVTSDGLAVGQINQVPGTTTATGMSIAGLLAAAGKPLATCPSRTPWPAPGCPPV